MHCAWEEGDNSNTPTKKERMIEWKGGIRPEKSIKLVVVFLITSFASKKEEKAKKIDEKKGNSSISLHVLGLNLQHSAIVLLLFSSLSSSLVYIMIYYRFGGCCCCCFLPSSSFSFMSLPDLT